MNHADLASVRLDLHPGMDLLHYEIRHKIGHPILMLYWNLNL